MYHSSHSGLEYLAHSSASYFSTPAFYALAAAPSTYNDGMFIPSRDGRPFHYSSLENMRSATYSASTQNYALFSMKEEYHFIPDNFLKPGKEGIFVGETEEIKEFIEEAFEKIFQEPFPNNIKVSILNQEEFRKIAPSPNTIGLSLNRGQQGLLSEIFILNDSLGRVMLTIGHELGHVLTRTLANPHDEEAKAYAFSLVWMEAIKEHDIANLAEAIVTERPAENGLHNVSFNFVHEQIAQGKEAEEIYDQLVKEDISLALIRFM